MKQSVSNGWSRFLLLLVFGAMPVSLAAQPANASAEETQWFAGEWIVTPAPVDGFDDIVTEVVSRVTIEYRGGASIVRHSPERNGRPAVAAEFTVKKIGKTFPWWSEVGGSGVVRLVSDTIFDLATVGPMGRADWSRALRHTRVESTDKPAEDAPESKPVSGGEPR